MDRMRDRVPVPSSEATSTRGSRSSASSRSIDCGRYRAKRTVGDDVVGARPTSSATATRSCARSSQSRGPGETDVGRGADAPHRRPRRRRPLGGPFAVDRARHAGSSRVEAWTDPFASWRDELDRKVAAGQEDLTGELSEGVVLLEAALKRAKGKDDKSRIEAGAGGRRGDEQPPGGARRRGARRRARRRGRALAGPRRQRRGRAVRGRRRPRRSPASASWYELFPRSWGGFKGVAKQLPALAELGFDVLYLPPIHPIGVTNRKGAQQRARRRPGRPRQPVGDRLDGRRPRRDPPRARHDRGLRRARRRGATSTASTIALDFAIQCSADHPWLTEHPEWFNRRPDGTLKYAENPPKKYQDIYNVNWDSEDWRGLWKALLDVVAALGRATASRSSASTTRTPSRCRSGSG